MGSEEEVGKGRRIKKVKIKKEITGWHGKEMWGCADGAGGVQSDRGREEDIACRCYLILSLATIDSFRGV